MPCRKRATTKASSEPEMAQAIEPSDEDDDRDAEDALGAEPVGHPAADRDEDGERHEIGGQRQLQRDRAGADIGGDRRQRGRDHGRVHVLHEQGDREDERDGAVQSAIRGRRLCFRRLTASGLGGTTEKWAKSRRGSGQAAHLSACRWAGNIAMQALFFRNGRVTSRCQS